MDRLAHLALGAADVADRALAQALGAPATSPAYRTRTRVSGRKWSIVRDPRGVADPQVMRMIAVIGIVCGLVAAARADERVHGFVTYGTGELRGSVHDDDGTPLPGVDVHLVSADGSERVVRTDRDGAYHATLPGGASTLVYVPGDAHVAGQASVPTGSQDVIEIHDIVPPAVPVTPVSRADRILPYSDRAIDADVWTRAWLLLDVSETGAVTRVKLINAPGYDLDAIAIRAALDLTFQPARDRSNRAIRSIALWTFEWPAYWWLIGSHLSVVRLPSGAESERCRTAGPVHGYARDCSRPDLSRVLSQPWRDRAHLP